MSDFKRQHPIAAIASVIDTIKQNFVTLIILLFISTSQSDGNFWYFILAGILVSLIAGVVSWWMFKFRVVDDELQINKGLFVKSKLYLSKDRIQVIDITEGLLQRMFGLVQVEVKTAGSGTESATISAISREEAENLRQELRKRSISTEGESHQELFEEIEEQKEEIEATWRLSKRDLIFAAFTSGNFGLIASILGAVSGQLDQFINEETIDYIYETMPGFNNVTIIISIVTVIIFISWLLSFLGVIFRYSDFKLEKTSKELLITSGLIERKQITVPFNRIQAIRFVEGIFRQPFGYGMVYIESAGFDQKNERSIVIAPFMASRSFSSFLNEFLSDFEEPEFHIKPRRKSLFRYVIKPNYILLISTIIAWFLWDSWWLILLLFPFFALLGFQRYRDAALALSENILRMRFRVLARTTAIISRNRIQKIECTANPFQRRKNLQSLKATAASGAQGIDFEITDLNEDDALHAFSWVTGQINRAPHPEPS